LSPDKEFLAVMKPSWPTWNNSIWPCADLFRASTPWFSALTTSMVGTEAGHDDKGGRLCPILPSKKLPRTVLRDQGDPRTATRQGERSGGRLGAVAVSTLFVLYGCGWGPLYADVQTEPASEALRAIKVDPIPERIGQQLAIALRNSLNPTGEPTTPRYRLSTALVAVLSNLGIQSQGLATLGQVDAIAAYQLIDLQNGRVLLNNTVHVANSFDLNPNQYSTLVGEDDARARSVDELDREIVTRLTLFMERRAAEQSPKPG
jgi:LPS-assembly lipoprotein